MPASLRDIRLSKGIRQIWLAKQLGVDRKTLENYEGEKTRVPRAVVFMAAHLLNVSPEEINGWDVKPVS